MCGDLITESLGKWPKDLKGQLLKHTKMATLLNQMGITELQMVPLLLDAAAGEELQAAVEELQIDDDPKEVARHALQRVLHAAQLFRLIDLAKLNLADSFLDELINAGMGFSEFYTMTMKDPLFIEMMSAAGINETDGEETGEMGENRLSADEISAAFERFLRKEAEEEINAGMRLKTAGQISKALAKMRNALNFFVAVKEESDLPGRISELEQALVSQDILGQTSSRQLTVKSVAPADVHGTPPAKPATWKVVALIISVGEYEGGTKLKLTAKDAASLASRLKKMGGDEAQVKTLNEKNAQLQPGQPRTVTRQEILRVVAETAAIVNEDPANTVVIFAFFGGATQGFHAGQRHNYLMPQDLFGKSNLQESKGDILHIMRLLHAYAISLEDVLHTFGRENPHAIWGILDCCHEMAFAKNGDGIKLPNGMVEMSLPKGLVQMVQPPERTMVLFAAAPGHVVNEEDESADHHSLLTQAVLDRIRDCRVGGRSLQQISKAIRQAVVHNSGPDRTQTPAVITKDLHDPIYLMGQSFDLAEVDEVDPFAKYTGALQPMILVAATISPFFLTEKAEARAYSYVP